ncbi:MAG: glycoside hydrolase family 13 protein [Bacillus sp. (in: firmicutes)]
MKIDICSRFTGGNFRYPSEAVPTHSNIAFDIQVPRYYGLKAIDLVWISDDNNQYEYIKMNWIGMEKGRDIFSTTVTVEKQGLIWYYFRLVSQTNISYVGKQMDTIIETEEEPPSWQLTVYDESFTTPDWIKGGMFYHIFVDRFAKEGSYPMKQNTVFRKDWGGMPVFAPNENGEVMNNDFFGGNFKGIISKLDYLQSLGVNCLYLSPIFEAYSNHKYDTGDYMKIDPMFGTLEDFHKLCIESEKRGMRILLDGVFNHTGSDSIYFNKKGTYNSVGAYQSKSSEYYSWFKFIEYPDKYESWWGIDTLPSVDESDPSYMEFVTGENGVGIKWLKEGASGWRLDVADELPDLFLEKFREHIKNVDRDALIIGEVWEDASHKIAYGKRRNYFYGQQLDSVMNYPFMNAIIRFIRYRDAENIHNTVTSILQNYPPCVVHCLMNMIGTHDTRRALTALGGDELHNASKEEKSVARMTERQRKEGLRLLKLATLLQMTLPGVPCIYYGDEAGMEGYEDPFNRRCYPWGKEDRNLLGWYRKLGAIRKAHSVFKEGTYETIYGKEGVFLFQRSDETEKVVIGVNRSEQPFQIEVEHTYKDLLYGKEVGDEYVIQPNEGCLLLHIE